MTLSESQAFLTMPHRITGQGILQRMNGRDLLQALVKASRKKLGTICREARASQPQIYRFLKGETKEPKRDTLLPIARYFGIDVEAFSNPELAKMVAVDRGFLSGPAETAIIMSINGKPLRMKALQVAEKLSEMDETRYEAMCAMILAAIDALPPPKSGEPPGNPGQRAPAKRAAKRR